MASTNVTGEAHSASALLSAVLQITEEQIIPLTRTGVSSGCKLFGAAIMARSDLSSLVVATNNERASPLLHGEINCIQQFFLASAGRDGEASDGGSRRPSTADCIFFATHEPCSLCLSGIAWAGFREFYYLFTYADSRDRFAIPYDIDILEEVFRVPAPSDTPETLAARPLYNKKNKFFTGRSLAELLAEVDDRAERDRLAQEIERIKRVYNDLSDTYQEWKKTGAETASVWK